MKYLGQDHDLYVQSDTLLLADAFENFRNMYIKINKLDPVKQFLAPGLVWQAALRKAKVELDLLTDIDIDINIINQFVIFKPFSYCFKET